MTLAVVIATPDSIWTLADRQLMAEGGAQSSDACKIVGFDSTDGVGLLTYAGPGTLGDTDPSDWVASVFEGLDTDLSGYMMALAEAATSLPAETRSARPGHLFVAAAVADGKPVIYSLTTKATGEISLKRHEGTYAFMLAGAGGAALAGVKAKIADDAREIVDWIKKAETEGTHPREAADRLVKWTGEARRESDDVGSRSIVAYRFVRDGEAAAGRLFHDGTKLEAPDTPLLHLSRGADVNKMFELMKREAMGAVLSLRETAQLIAYKRRTAGSD